MRFNEFGGIFMKKTARNLGLKKVGNHYMPIQFTGGHSYLKNSEESKEMEMVCPDCGVCETHGNLDEIKKGQKDSNGYTKCWSGYHAQGTKKSKTTGKMVRNCVPNESITEKWSAKYKRSINCSHPKGFSQRAHCAGKKKHR
jgi:hypothetical protein